MTGIIVDSCCDISKEFAEKNRIGIVPFKIYIDGVEYVDNDKLDKNNFLEKMKASKNPIRTSCPSPFEFKEKILEMEEDELIIITISKQLSGTYNAAKVGMEEAQKENPNKKIHILDSLSAAAGEVSLLYSFLQWKDKFDFETLVEKLEERVKELKTFFILERFDNLVKNGRMKKVTGILAGALNIRPIMQGVKGEIEVFQINRGFKKSLINLAKSFGNISHDFQDKILFITESNDVKKAELFKEKVKELYNFKDIIILEAKGLSTTYADDGGIVIAF